MKRDDEFLADLKAEFRSWRRQKRCRGESCPEDLVAKARAAAAEHGPMRVARALRVENTRIIPTMTKDQTLPTAPVVSPTSPSFSRIQVTFPRDLQAPQVLMEVETPVGMKIRLFAMTPETINALSSFCRGEGAL